MGKTKGYVTFCKINNEESKKDSYRYFYPDTIRVGDTILVKDIVGKTYDSKRDKMIICKSLADTLRHFEKEEWGNLIFTEVESDNYTISEGNYYNYPIALANSVTVLRIIPQIEVYSRMLGAINALDYDVSEFERYMAGIKLSSNEKEDLIEKVKSRSHIQSYTNKLLAPIAFYQDGDEGVYKRISSNPNTILYPEYNIKKRNHK